MSEMTAMGSCAHPSWDRSGRACLALACGADASGTWLPEAAPACLASCGPTNLKRPPAGFGVPAKAAPNCSIDLG